MNEHKKSPATDGMVQRASSNIGTDFNITDLPDNVKLNETLRAKNALEYLLNCTEPNFDFEGLSEKSFAETIAKATDGLLRYSKLRGWLVWDQFSGKFISSHGIEFCYIAEMGKHFIELTLHIDDRLVQKEAYKFGASLLKASGIANIEKLMRYERVIYATEDDFDSEPNLVNCNSKVYDLNDLWSDELNLKSAGWATHKHMFTKSCSVFPKSGEPEKFKKFMDWFTCNDVELYNWILTVMAMSLFGFPCSLIINFYGPGRNGKGLLLRLFYKMLGDYSTVLSRNLVVKNRYREGRFDKANLPGARVAICFDLKIEPGEKLNLDDLKLIAGDGDYLNIERKGKEIFSAQLFCKIFIASNEKIPIDSFGESEKRRFRLMPCNAHITEPNPELETELEKEYPQILHLLLKYAAEWNENGRVLPDCEAVNKATRNYFDNQDVLGQFIADKCVLGEGLRIPKKALFDAYSQYMFSAQGISRAGKMKTFAAMLEKRGIFERVLKYNGEPTRVFAGINLVNQDDKVTRLHKNTEFSITPCKKNNIVSSMDLENSCNLVTLPTGSTETAIFRDEEQEALWKDENAVIY